MSWKHLKSGTDVRGVATGENPTLTPEIVERLAAAFAHYAAEKTCKPAEKVCVAIGRDSRVTGPAFAAAAARGVCSTGASVQDYGLCTTPAMYMSILTSGFSPDASIMLTASHLPAERNGMKFFLPDGGLDGKAVDRLLETAETALPAPAATPGAVTRPDFLSAYRGQLAERIRTGLGTDAEKPLEGLRIAVDAGNGAGGFFAELMAELGADTAGSRYLEPDGTFPNHIPNPENPTAMAAIREAVVASGADLGVIFDCDCDRAAIVDSDGREINRNRLIALISAILLEKQPGATIVTDSVTSAGLKDFIAAHGGTHYRFKRGYRNVIDEALRLNREGTPCPLAIETSGHAALQENHFLDDGMYLVTVLIVEAMRRKQAGQTLGSLIADLREPVESAEIRMNITAPDFRAAGSALLDRVLAKAEAEPAWHLAPDNREGVRVSFDVDGQPDSAWFLLRLSLHDPVLPLNAESDVPGGLRQVLQALLPLVETAEGIDSAPLRGALAE